jgi:RNA polymerase sigma factor (sigma-70 family)
MASKLSKEFSKLVNEMLNTKKTDPMAQAFKKYIKLILVMAHKYTRPRVVYEDVVAEGMKGLVEAVNDFDPNRPTKSGNPPSFKQYLIVRVRGRMYEFFIANSKCLHIPTHVSKALTYVEKMFAILNKEPKLYNYDIKPIEIIVKFTHPGEEYVHPKNRKKIRRFKEIVSNLASNSMTSYETIVARALMGFSSEITVDGIERELADSINCLENDCERFVFIIEQSKILEKLLGGRKYHTLKLKMFGYNYKEISERLFDAGYTKWKISRQAVRGSLEQARIILKRVGIIIEI